MKKFARGLKWVGILLGTYLLVLGGYFFYSLFTAAGRVKPLCAQIKIGIPISELKTFSSEHGLTQPHKASDANFTLIVEGRSYGRHGCKITFEGDLVKAVEYSFQD